MQLIAALTAALLVSSLTTRSRAFSAATTRHRPSRSRCAVPSSSADDAGNRSSANERLQPPSSVPQDAPRKTAAGDRSPSQHPDPASPLAVGDSDSLVRTFDGGLATIFEMAQKSMLDWNSEGSPTPASASERPTSSPSKPRVLPRWHPHQGISDVNPNFRTQPPVMNNQGYARSMWRNVRKRNKPSLWKQTLRTYDRMAHLEQKQSQTSRLQIQRSNTHHEAALLACAKLGLWQRALDIYRTVTILQQQQRKQRQEQYQQLASLSPTARAATPKMTRRIAVTDSMIHSLVSACVRGSRQRVDDNNSNTDSRVATQRMRREPLDKAVAVIRRIDARHNIPVTAQFVNPIASAYIRIGCVTEAQYVIRTLLTNRTAGDEPEDGNDIFNIYDVCAKDKGSHSLLVSAAVSDGEWADAVEALAEMNESGLYPTSRHCNSWYEISERRSKPRAVRSWKKRRDDSWVESLS